MDNNDEYRPPDDFVSKTMRRIQAYEAARTTLSPSAAIGNALQRSLLALGGALFGILHATIVF